MKVHHRPCKERSSRTREWMNGMKYSTGMISSAGGSPYTMHISSNASVNSHVITLTFCSFIHSPHYCTLPLSAVLCPSTPVSRFHTHTKCCTGTTAASNTLTLVPLLSSLVSRMLDVIVPITFNALLFTFLVSS